MEVIVKRCLRNLRIWWLLLIFLADKVHIMLVESSKNPEFKRRTWQQDRTFLKAKLYSKEENNCWCEVSGVRFWQNDKKLVFAKFCIVFCRHYCNQSTIWKHRQIDQFQLTFTVILEIHSIHYTTNKNNGFLSHSP